MQCLTKTEVQEPDASDGPGHVMNDLKTICSSCPFLKRGSHLSICMSEETQELAFQEYSPCCLPVIFSYTARKRILGKAMIFTIDITPLQLESTINLSRWSHLAPITDERWLNSSLIPLSCDESIHLGQFKSILWHFQNSYRESAGTSSGSRIDRFE